MEVEKIQSFIKQSFRKAHKNTAVIALSGGIDSAVSFALTVNALGPENVHAFHLPAKNSNPIHLEDCRQLISSFKPQASNFHVIPIRAIIQKTWRILKHYSTDAESGIFSAQESEGTRALQNPDSKSVNKLRLANIAARVRMMIIFDQAKKFDALVIGTENYSEHLLGYYTRFGDEASDIEPIRHLYKTQVIELAKQLNIPESIITKPPTADLWKGQTDATELGFTYNQADPILQLLDQGQTPESIKTSFDSQLVDTIVTQVNSVKYKHHVPYLFK